MKSEVSNFIGLAVILVCCIAWLTHIVYCFGHSAWGFLIAGAILPPIGVFHGIYLWL